MRQVLLAIGLAAALAGCGASGNQNGAETIPPFRAKTLKGETITNESARGKLLLVQFWATWCGYCRREQPVIEKIRREYRPDDLEILAVSVREDRGTVEEYLSSSPRSVKIVLTADTNLTRLFPTRGFPTYVLIDRDGRLADAQEGAAGEAGLKAMFDRAGLKPKP